MRIELDAEEAILERRYWKWNIPTDKGPGSIIITHLKCFEEPNCFSEKHHFEES